jgi:hypothetical protein
MPGVLIDEHHLVPFANVPSHRHGSSDPAAAATKHQNSTVATHRLTPGVVVIGSTSLSNSDVARRTSSMS